MRAALNYIATGERSQGGSTITQQLARAYFLTPERSFVRKAKELILAVQIEQEFSKAEILSLYLNKIFLGQRAYGVAAAAEVYFGKPLAELSLAEAATIAGIPKAPVAAQSGQRPGAGDAAAGLRARAHAGSRLHRRRRNTRPPSPTPMVARLHGPRVELEAPVRHRDGARRDGRALRPGGLHGRLQRRDDGGQPAADRGQRGAGHRAVRVRPPPRLPRPERARPVQENQRRAGREPATRRCRPCSSATPATRICARRWCCRSARTTPPSSTSATSALSPCPGTASSGALISATTASARRRRR